MMHLFLDELHDLSLGFYVIKVGSKPFILTASSRTSILFAIISLQQRPLSLLNFFKLATMAEFVDVPQVVAVASDANFHCCHHLEFWGFIYTLSGRRGQPQWGNI